MNFKRLKKVLAAVLATTMVMSSALMVCAADASVSGNDSSTSDDSNSGDDSSSDSQEEYTPPTYEETMSQPSNAPISVAGSEVRTSIGGVYAASSVLGAAITTPADEVRSALGLSDGQNPVIIVYDVDTQKSVHAMASLNAAADAMGADIVSSLHIQLGAKQNGEWVELSDGNVALKTGLPKDADTTLTYSALCVKTGGEIIMLEDLDTDPKTVTFAVGVGVGAYAIVAQ